VVGKPIRRPGFSLVELLVVLLILLLVLGLLFPAIQQGRYGGGMASSRSANNLKQMGLSMHNWAANTKGKIYVGDAGGVGSTRGPFWVQSLPFLEGDIIYNNISGNFNGVVVAGTITDPPGAPGSATGYPPFKAYYAPLDPLADPTLPHLSYGLNGYLVGLCRQDNNRPPGYGSCAGAGTATGRDYMTAPIARAPNWMIIIPATVSKRGTSHTVATAERTANKTGARANGFGAPRYYANATGVGANATTPYYNVPVDAYFYPPHISFIKTPSAGFDFRDATAFSRSGVQVLMMDGSVRRVAPSQGGSPAGDNSVFDIACSLNNGTKLPAGW
jgi:prepilin-type N-terminal cleavage/methylation domain-containing protein